jgi:hypothetical protein
MPRGSNDTVAVLGIDIGKQELHGAFDTDFSCNAPPVHTFGSKISPADASSAREKKAGGMAAVPRTGSSCQVLFATHPNERVRALGRCWSDVVHRPGTPDRLGGF